MPVRPFFALLAAGLLAAHASAETRCSRSALSAAAAELRQARTALIAVPVGDMDTDVPPAASRTIERLKDRLQLYVAAAMACTPATASDRVIADRLRAQGDAGQRGPNTNGHGRDLDYAVDPVPNHAGWIAIIPGFDIECGGDAIVLVYHRDGTRWRLAMALRSAPYKEVSGGWEEVEVNASPAGADGRWYVALTHGTPWCTSTWSAYHYVLARPTSDPARPDIFRKGDVGFNRTYRHAVRAMPRWFELRTVDFSHDSDIIAATTIHRWAIDGDRTHRVPPFAPTAQDFVDAWIMNPWRVVARSSAPGLAALHNRLGWSDGNQHHYIGTNFGQIRACPGNRTEVALQPETGPDFYLMIESRSGLDFRLLRAARRHDPRCDGPDQRHEKPLLPQL